MADDKKNIPEAAPPAEAPAPAVENAAVPEQSAPKSALTDAEAVMLEHEGQAALFEMGDAVPDPADAVTHAEVEEPAAPEVPKAEKKQKQPPAPGKDAPTPSHSGKVVDFAAARDEAAKEEKKAVKQKPPTEKDKTAKPGRDRPPKADKAAPAGRRRLRVLVLGHSLFLRGTAPAGLGLLGFRLGFFLFAAFSRWFRRRFLFHLFTGGIAALLQ